MSLVLFPQSYEKIISYFLFCFLTFCSGGLLQRPNAGGDLCTRRCSSINVSKAFQILVHEGSVEKRRGLGMFLDGCAIGNLREVERQLFLNIELPAFKARVARFGYTLEELI